MEIETESGRTHRELLETTEQALNRKFKKTKAYISLPARNLGLRKQIKSANKIRHIRAAAVVP